MPLCFVIFRHHTYSLLITMIHIPIRLLSLRIPPFLVFTTHPIIFRFQQPQQSQGGFVRLVCVWESGSAFKVQSMSYERKKGQVWGQGSIASAIISRP